jgi:hypothetical protein
MAPQIIAAVASLLVALITVVAPILTGSQFSPTRMIEADLLQKLQTISPDEAQLVQQVLNNRLQVWEKRSRSDTEAWSWRATWPLVGVAVEFTLLSLLLAPTLVSGHPRATQQFLSVLKGLALISWAFAVGFFRLYQQRR